MLIRTFMLDNRRHYQRLLTPFQHGQYGQTDIWKRRGQTYENDPWCVGNSKIGAHASTKSPTVPQSSILLSKNINNSWPSCHPLLFSLLSLYIGLIFRSIIRYLDLPSKVYSLLYCILDKYQTCSHFHGLSTWIYMHQLQQDDGHLLGSKKGTSAPQNIKTIYCDMIYQDCFRHVDKTSLQAETLAHTRKLVVLITT